MSDCGCSKTKEKKPVILNPLCCAAANGYKKMTEFLIEYDSNLIDKVDSDGETPLTEAISREKLDIATVLIENGANVNIKGRLENSPLSCAIVIKDKCSYNELSSESRDELINLLLDKGALVSDKEIFYAARQNDLDMVKRLCEIRDHQLLSNNVDQDS